MTIKYFYTSLTRISNLPEVSFSVEELPREEWEAADYVVGEVSSPPGGLSQVELANGRMVEVVEGIWSWARSVSATRHSNRSATGRKSGTTCKCRR